MALGFGRRHPYKLYGAALLAVIAGLVTLSILAFDQAFTPATYVTVHIQRAGLQLLPGSDVKVRGLIVGSVQDITSTGYGADIKLRLQPSQAKRIPANVAVRLVPKTLFGEKYVDLVLPAQPSPQHLTDGAVIAEDQTRPALEIDQALNDLLPVLKAVPPVQLDNTLTALASALSGRGAELGRTITQLDGYLKRFDPQLPRLSHDMAALSGVTRTYAQAATPLLHTLGNLAVTSTTIVDERQQLSAFLADVTGAGNETRDLLARNAHDLIAVNRVSRPVLSVLARYSPEFPCFVRGYARLVPRVHAAVPKTPGLNHAAHVVVEFVPSFPTYSNPIDLPQFKDNRGPHCYGLPSPKQSLPVIHYKDGTQDDPRFRTQGKVGAAPSGRGPGPASTSSPSMGSAGTAAEQRALDSILGPVLGIDASRVPDIADLLWGPLARGAAVNLS
jgi:phospholipid/cholesterol/gamma-HCH transport system substrate-binding protein